MVISIGRNPSKRDELLRYAFIGFSLVEVSGLIGLVMSFLLLFGFLVNGPQWVWINRKTFLMVVVIGIVTHGSQFG